VIPTYNRSAIVGCAIESALGQTYPHLECVVVDDGSLDDTRAVVESYGPRVRYFYQENAGVTAARNHAMRRARGEFLAFLDSDDLWKPWRIESQVAALRRHPNAGLAWTDMTAVERSGKEISERYLRTMYAAHSKVSIEKTMQQVEVLGALCAEAPAEYASTSVRFGDLFSEILLGNLLHTSTVMVRRDWVGRVGGFDPTFVRAGEDYEFYVRLCSLGPAIFIDAPSTLYCVGASDQLTRPSMLLEIARNNLRTIQKWVPHAGQHLTIPRQTTQTRFADSYAWLGEAELDAGNRLAAAQALVASIVRRPRLDRRALLLARCLMPDRLSTVLRDLRAKLRLRRRSRAAHYQEQPSA
jgi:GT2 family glycosyltransferase